MRSIKYTTWKGKKSKSMTGILYLVATPIGNLEDMTFRAVTILKEVDLIAAEDTRQSIKLLKHFNIDTDMTSYHDHNKEQKGEKLIAMLKQGKNIALISDAGTPGISDPGEDLVRLCHEEGISVSACPGCVAGIMGLILSGFTTGRFVFEGFLPVNRKRKKERLQSLQTEVRTIIFYEAPHKLLTTLEDILEQLGNRRITLARELTKRYEEIKQTRVEEAVQFYQNQSPKGEFVLILEGMDYKEKEEIEQKQWEDMSVIDHISYYEQQGINRKEALKAVAKDRGMSKREIYKIQLQEQNEK